ALIATERESLGELEQLVRSRIEQMRAAMEAAIHQASEGLEQEARQTVEPIETMLRPIVATHGDRMAEASAKLAAERSALDDLYHELSQAVTATHDRAADILREQAARFTEEARAIAAPVEEKLRHIVADQALAAEEAADQL